MDEPETHAADTPAVNTHALPTPAGLGEASIQPAAALEQGTIASRPKVLAWALWDWGTQPFQTVITTFVFSVYLTSNSFGAGTGPDKALAWAIGLAGLVIALVAPVLGQNADRTGRTVFHLRWQTWALALISGALFFVQPSPSYLVLGLVLLAVGNIISEIAGVNYNATIEQVATGKNVGRVSGLGWGMGYLGGIIVLLVIYFALIAPKHLDHGLDVRIGMLICMAWTLVFTIPPLLVLHDRPASTRPSEHLGVIGSYRALGVSLVRLWRTARQTFWFLVASALFRDGLAGVFTFGAVIAADTFGFSAGQVIIFGAAANVVAGISTILFGMLDDRLGPHRVIMISLSALVLSGMAIFFLHDGGQKIFWIFGMVLCLFVGPAQSASRSYLARLIPPGRAGEVFGLYATTGRAVSFLSPFMFGVAITVGELFVGRDHGQYFGILGIVLVLVAGLVAMILVGRVRNTANAF